MGGTGGVVSAEGLEENLLAAYSILYPYRIHNLRLYVIMIAFLLRVTRLLFLSQGRVRQAKLPWHEHTCAKCTTSTGVKCATPQSGFVTS